MQMPWDNDPIVSPPQASPFGSRPVIREAPPMPSPRHPEEREAAQLDVQLKRQELADRKRKAQEAQKGLKPAAVELRNVIDAAFRAKELSRDWFATGFGSGISQMLGGTKASDVKAKLDTIGANTAFEQLQKMREASPTGGALGQVTERELDLLKSTIASLDQAQSDEQFQGAMQTIAESYGRVLAKLPGGKNLMQQRGWLKKMQPQKKPTSGGIQFLGFE